MREARVWDETFAALHDSSPDLARSTREWRLLRSRVNALSDLASDWGECQPMIHLEMPFYWKMTDERSLEGLIDLALFDPTAINGSSSIGKRIASGGIRSIPCGPNIVRNSRPTVR